jgi:hypothetical protein
LVSFSCKKCFIVDTKSYFCDILSSNNFGLSWFIEDV